MIPPRLFAITQHPTPVFNTPDFPTDFGGIDGNTLKMDDQQLVRSVETVLFTGAKIELLKEIVQDKIWQIKSEDYPYPGNYYIDIRFAERCTAEPSVYRRPLPNMLQILKTLTQLHDDNIPYVWGGNYPMGIPKFKQLYPPSSWETLSPQTRANWSFEGVDCSGLLYYVTNGCTPRNTSSLVDWGTAVPIAGKSAKAISQTVQDLDLILIKGHLWIVLDHKTAIESRVQQGVVTSDLFALFEELMKTRKPVDAWGSTKEPHFVVRRWHKDNLSPRL